MKNIWRSSQLLRSAPTPAGQPPSAFPRDFQGWLQFDCVPMSPTLRTLLRGLLEPDMQRRASADKALQQLTLSFKSPGGRGY